MLLGGLLSACSSEPVFPDPGFDATRDIRDTIRRDTIENDIYYLKMKISAPNGINTIQILDGLTYKELDRLEEYNGQTDFTMKYPVSLKEVNEKDSTMNFIVKIVDNDMRTYNKAYILTIKPFSRPTVTFTSGVEGTLGLASPVFELKALFETGLRHIHSYSVSFEDEIIDEAEMGDTLSEFSYRHVCHLKMEKGRNYRLNIRLTDDEGNSSDKNLTLQLADIDPVSKIIVNRNSKVMQELEFFYNKTNPVLLDSIIGLKFSYSISSQDGHEVKKEKPIKYYFEYNADGQVTHLDIWDDVYNEVTWTSEFGHAVSWEYTYDSQKRLTKVENMDETGDKGYDIVCTEWDEKGRIANYGFIKDDPYMADFHWHIKPSGDAVPMNLWMVMHRSEFTVATRISDVVIPTYLPGLPPVLATDYGNQHDLQCLLMWNYGIENMHRHNFKGNDMDTESYDPEQPLYKMIYFTNINGRVERMQKFRMSGFGSMQQEAEYVFVY